MGVTTTCLLSLILPLHCLHCLGGGGYLHCMLHYLHTYHSLTAVWPGAWVGGDMAGVFILPPQNMPCSWFYLWPGWNFCHMSLPTWSFAATLTMLHCLLHTQGASCLPHTASFVHCTPVLFAHCAYEVNTLPLYLPGVEFLLLPPLPALHLPACHLLSVHTYHHLCHLCMDCSG